MADLTAKLIWYRLNEGGLNMVSALLRLFSELDVLNALLLGWMLLTGLVATLVTFYQRVKVETGRKGRVGQNSADDAGVGSSAKRMPLAGPPPPPPPPSSSDTPSSSAAGGCPWINAVAQWLQARGAGAAQIAPSVLLALSEESRHLADDIAISFDSIVSGNVVPKVAAVAAEATSSPNLVLTARLEFQDIRLAVRTSRPASVLAGGSGVAAQCQQHAILNLQRLSSKVTLQLTYVRNDDLTADVRFDDNDCSVQAELEECKDSDSAGRGGRSCALAAMKGGGASGGSGGGGGILKKSGSGGGITGKATVSHQTIGSSQLQKHILQVLRAAMIKLQIPGLTCEMVPANSQLRTSVAAAAAAASSGPPKPPRALAKTEISSDGKLQLMIKLRKATGLGAPNAGNTSPYCKVELDYPAQAYITCVSQNTVNPYWDEHFLFQISLGSKAIKFSIFDKEKKSPDDFLGQALLDLDKVRTSNPGCVLVLPLADAAAAAECGRTSSCVSGSITVEMQFVESSSDDAEPSGPGVISASTQSLISENGPVGIGPTVASQQQQQRHLAVPGHRSSPMPSSAAAAITAAAAAAAPATANNPAGLAATQGDSVSRSSMRTHGGGDRLSSVNASGLLQRSRSSILHVGSSLDADFNADWSPDRDAPTFGHDDAGSSVGRSDTDIFRSLDLNNAEVVIVSSEQMAEVAVRELRRQLKHPGVSGSRTSTVVITSVHKEPARKVGDEPYGRSSELSSSCTTPPERPLSDGTNSAGDSKERKSRLSAFKRHFSKSKDKKARSHSIERSTDIDSSLKSPTSPDKIHDGTAAILSKRERNSTGSNVRKLFSGGGKRSDSGGGSGGSGSQPRSSGSLPRLIGFEPHLHCTGTLATAVVVASGSASLGGGGSSGGGPASDPSVDPVPPRCISAA